MPPRTSDCLRPATAGRRSVRFGLLPEEEQAALAGSLAGPRGGAPLDSMQLRSRHWLIKDARGAVESEVGARPGSLDSACDTGIASVGW